MRSDDQEVEQAAHARHVAGRAQAGEAAAALPHCRAVTAPTPTRRWIQPEPGDTLASIAARELPELPPADAQRALQSWNLHLLLRPGMPGTPIGADVVWLEPPRPK
jgi:hypothetical protein